LNCLFKDLNDIKKENRKLLEEIMICKEEKFVLEKCALESTNIDEKKTVSKLNGKKKVSFDQEVLMTQIPNYMRFAQ